MGTNYFHRTDICGSCGRFDHVHIGKDLTNFEGRFGYDDDSKPVPEIVSWAQWRDRLRAGGEVWDEYGVRFDTDEFIARVEATEPPMRRRQFDWEVQHAAEIPGASGWVGVIGRRCSWLDADGFSFHGGEFS